MATCTCNQDNDDEIILTPTGMPGMRIVGETGPRDDNEERYHGYEQRRYADLRQSAAKGRQTAAFSHYTRPQRGAPHPGSYCGLTLARALSFDHTPPCYRPRVLARRY
jgi:hypothetical protein